MYLVTKNGMVHQCDTEERHQIFLKSGWVDYHPPKEEKKVSPGGGKKK